MKGIPKLAVGMLKFVPTVHLIMANISDVYGPPYPPEYS